MQSVIQVLFLKCQVIPYLPSCQVFSTKTKIYNKLFVYPTTLIVTVTINEQLHRFSFVYLKERREKHATSLVRDM
jgi:hypothetical protein